MVFSLRGARLPAARSHPCTCPGGVCGVMCFAPCTVMWLIKTSSVDGFRICSLPFAVSGTSGSVH